MKIEEAIKQNKPFKNEWVRASVNLMYTENWLRYKTKKLLKPFGITVQQYNVLRILRGAGRPITTSKIRERLLDRMADTSRLVDRLFSKGLVTRQVCEHDKRLVDVAISEEGALLLKRMDQISDDIAQTLDHLTEDEAALLNNLLDKMRGKE